MASDRSTLGKAAGGPVGYARSLLDLLKELREAAGSPSLTTLAGRISPASGKATSKGYLSEIFGGSRTPSGAKAEAIAKALHADENVQKRVRWLADNAAADGASRRMSTPQGDGSPGWWARSDYIEVVRGLAPIGGLRDRADELAELARFCEGDGDDPYLWWQAEPWAGKSALLATFVLDPPTRCDVVSFFVTASLAVQADATACTDALLDQLSALTGEQLQPALTGSTRDGHRRKLLRIAAERAHDRGRRLVLVLDGLDEDRGTRPGSGLSSVAALLPAVTVAGLRVVVASRSSPGLPDDVPQGHPLRCCGVRQLVASPYARDLGRRASQELQDQLFAGAVGREVLGFITASQGGLTAADLSELTGRAPFEVESTLAGVLGRTVGVRNGRSTGSLAFTHGTLAVEAVRRFGAALRRYQEELHHWAASYRDQGWPPETPHYMLQGYVRMVAAGGDETRLVDVVTDPVRHDRLQGLNGGDAAALAEVRAAEGVVSGTDGLLPVVRLATRRHELASQNEVLPVQLPAVWVALGQPDRAESLARGIADPWWRAAALNALVSALIKSGDHERAERLAFGLDIPFRRMAALTRLAEAAVERGGLADAARLVAAALSDADELRVEHRASLFARIAVVQVAIGDKGAAASLVEAAVTAAEEVVSWEDASHKDVTDVAAVLIRFGDPGRGERMVRDLVPQPEVPSGYAALAVVAHGLGEDALARRFIAHAAEVTDLLTDGYQRGTALVALARACIGVGDPDQARTFLHEGIKAENPIDYGAEEHDMLILELTSLAGQLGAMAEAEELADHIVSDSYENARAEVARAWGAAGRLDLAERIVDEELRAPYVCAAALTDLAALAVAGAPADAERLALRAQSAARANPYRQGRLLDALAASVATVGDKDLAAAVVRRIGSPVEQVAAMTGMVAAMVEAGGWAYAQEAATAAESALGSVTHPFDHGKQAAALVTAIVGAGDHERATRLASTIREPVWQVEAICTIAAAAGRGPQAWAQARQAEEIAVRIYRRDTYDVALVEVAAAYAHASADGKAQAVADRIEDDILRDRARFEIAKAAAVTGDHAAAEAITATIADEYVRDDAMAMRAEHQAAGGDLESATTLLLQLSDPDCRARAITAIAVAAAANGDWATAERYLTDLDNQHQTTRHLARLALTAAKASEISRARRYLLQALPDGELETLLPAIAATEPSTILYLARQVVEAEPDAVGPRRERIDATGKSAEGSGADLLADADTQLCGRIAELLRPDLLF